MSVAELPFSKWDDCHARLSVGTDETGSKIIATSKIFAALVQQAQCLVIWHADTCEEFRNINHGEYVTDFAVDRAENLVCTSGFQSIKICELATRRQLRVFDKHSDDRVIAVSFSTLEDHILVGYQDNLIACQNLRTGAQVCVFRVMLKGDENGNQGL